MPDNIQIKRGAQGASSAMQALAEGEPGYVTDKKELLIGTSAGNVVVGSEKSAKGIFEKVRIEAQTALASVANGTIFEDTDGVLKYKNLAGVVKTLVFDASTIEGNVAALQSNVTSLQNNKQDKTDNTLNTSSKTVVGAINELEARP